MQLSNLPGKLVLPFANAGGKNNIPVASQIGITAGAASLVDGFPPLTRTPIAAGGVPPSGLDVNGILYEMSAIVRWANAGGGYPFDSDFATDANVGGYPKGARVLRADGKGYWFNTVENNVTDPADSGAASAGWVPDFSNGVAAVTMTSANVTLTPEQYGLPIIIITGALTGDLNLIFPEIDSQWAVIDATSGNFLINAKTAAGIGKFLAKGCFNLITCANGDMYSSTTFVQSGANSVPSDIKIKALEVLSVLDYVPDNEKINATVGNYDVSAAVLSAFNDIRTKGYTESVLDFPNNFAATYLVSYGWLIPSGCKIKLNGSKIKATTTWGQGTIPSNGTTRSQFHIGGSLTPGATLTSDVKNIAILGDGATLDMRYEDQTGTPPGACGISIETTPAPIVGNLWRVHDVLVENIEIQNAMWYGTSVEGAKNVTFNNVRAIGSANLGHVVVCGWNVHYEQCHGSYSIERVANQGTGFWNEANETWQILRNITYHKCRAEYNRKSGFRYYNDGQDVEVSIFAEGNISRFNLWDGSAQVAGTAESGHAVNKSGTGTAEFIVQLDDCVAEEEYNSGFKVIRVSGGTTAQRVIINNPTAVNCNKQNLDSDTRSPIHVGGANNDSPVIINDPVIIAPAANTLGFGIATEYTQAVFINNPRLVGVFTAQMYSKNRPASRFVGGLPTAVLDVGASVTQSGTGGTWTEFRKPVRLTQFDQTAEPASSDMFDTELTVWQDDNNLFVGRYLSDDGLVRYLDFRPKKRIRAVVAYAGSSIPANDVVSAPVTVTGAALGDIVQVSYDADLANAGAGPELFAYVTAANTVRWSIANHSTGSRAIPAGNIIINVIGSGY